MVAQTKKQQDMVFKAIADPTRREILGLLAGGGRTVGEIAVNFRTSRPAISKHLRVLQVAGLVASRKHGATNVCTLNAKPLSSVSEWLESYKAFWDGNLRNLKKYVEEHP